MSAAGTFEKSFIDTDLRAKRIGLSRAADFLLQIAEVGPGARRSCALTAQLNAYIATGKLDPVTALDAQNQLCNNRRYDRYWSPPMFGPDHTWRAWPNVPGPLTRILNREYCLDLITPAAPYSMDRSLVPDIEEHLRRGGVAVLSGVSAVAKHARIAFEPAELEPGTIFVHDPHYSETTGLYSYDALEYLQTGPRTIFY